MRGVTQKQVFTAIGLGEKNYQMYEHGRIRPSHDSIIALCKFFNVSSDYLLGLTDDPTPKKQKKEAPSE